MLFTYYTANDFCANCSVFLRQITLLAQGAPNIYRGMSSIFGAQETQMRPNMPLRWSSLLQRNFSWSIIFSLAHVPLEQVTPYIDLIEWSKLRQQILF
jgi:hypothetical protein